MTPSSAPISLAPLGTNPTGSPLLVALAISAVLHAGLLVLEPGLDMRLRNPLADREGMVELRLELAAVARPSVAGESAPAEAPPAPASPAETPPPAAAAPSPPSAALALDPASQLDPGPEPDPKPEPRPEPIPVAPEPVQPPPATKPAAPDPPPKAKPRPTKPAVRPTDSARVAAMARPPRSAEHGHAMSARSDNGAHGSGHGAQSAPTAKALNGHAVAAARSALLVAPVTRYAPPPEYPEEARWEERTGATTLAFRIRPNGAASDIEVLASSGHADLDRAAVQALGRWRFQVDAAAPQDAHYRYRFRFRLD